MVDSTTDSNCWFEALANLNNTGVLMISPDNEVQFASTRARELLRCQPGASVTDCISTIGNQLASLLKHARANVDADKRDESYGMESFVPDPDLDIQRKVLVELHPINVHSCTGFLCIIQDQTDQEMLARELEMASRHEAMCRLYKNLAHDLKTPTAAAGYSLDLLQRLIDRLGDVNAETVDKVKKAFELLRESIDMLNGSLYMVLDELTASQLTEAPVNVREILMQAMQLIDPQAKKQEVATDLQLPHQDVVVHGNKHRLKYAILNLMMNALEAMPIGGHLNISLDCPAADVCRIAVKDDGTGIDVHAQNRIFRRHFTTKPTGSGIGLHSAREVIEGMKGAMSFETVPGEGSTFYIDLPMHVE